MNLIYQIGKNYWNSDSDGWQHWVDQKVISYHATQEGAQKQIEVLLAKELIDSQNRLVQPDAEYIKRCADQATRNYLTLDENGEIDEPLYYCRSIVLLD
jgi:hypothetical protein